MVIMFNSYPEMQNYLAKQKDRSGYWWTVKYINKKYRFILKKF